MEYAKLINGKPTKLVRFPNGTVILDGNFKQNPTEEEILSAGYLPVEETDEPEGIKGFYKYSKWVQTENAIVKQWKFKQVIDGANYAKLIDGKLTKCNVLPNGASILNGKFKQDTTEADILSAGYLPIEEQSEPENKEGFIKSYNWVQTDGAIVKKWTVKRDMSPMSQSDINKLFIEQQINTLSVDDNTALRMKSFYPEWAENIAYVAGYKVQYNGKLWRVRQAHTSIVTWEPENAPSLWETINETHDGTIEDAIPYDGNMALENGKYYTQNDVIYFCNRDTINPVYNTLSELVGLYVIEA